MVPLADQHPPGVSVQTELDAVTIRLPAGLRASSVNRSLVMVNIAVTGFLGLISTGAYLIVGLRALMWLETLGVPTPPMLLLFLVGFLWTLSRSVIYTLRRLDGFREAYASHRSTFRLGAHALHIPRHVNKTQSIDLSEVLYFDKGPPPRAQLKNKTAVVFAADRDQEAQAWLVAACQAILSRRGDASVGTEAIPKALQALAQERS